MNPVLEVYKKLYKEYGKQGWWPLSNASRSVKKGDKDYLNYIRFINLSQEDFLKNWPRHLGVKPKTEKQRLEISLGAILTQNTNWHNVEKALYNLNRFGLIDVLRLKNVDKNKLASLIKSAGYYNQKAKKIKMFLKFFDVLDRDELLKAWGLGPETVDSILLYAQDQPYFVVDAYTRRLFDRLGLVKGGSYDEIQRLVHDSLNKRYFKEFHALIVEHGKRSCKKSPECKGCVLRPICNF